MAKQFWSFIISYTTRNAIKRKGAIAELSISDAIPEILSFYVSLIVSVLLETVPKKSENSYKQTTTRQSRNQNKNNSS